MKVFVSGATGVIGRRAVAELVGAGHEVTAIARGAEKERLLTNLGVKPVRIDLFDLDANAAAMAGHDAVVNLATKIPPPSRAVSKGAWAENTRIRSEGSKTLVDAALRSGVGRFIQESICFLYPDSGDRWIDEDVALDPAPYAVSVLDAEAAANRFTESGGTGVVMRFGQLYAPEAAHTRYMCRMARLRLPAVPGPADAYTPALAADDAGSAVVAALAVPAGTYNVCDDEPLTRRRFNAAVAAAVGSKPPRMTGTAVARLSTITAMLLRSQRVANERFRHASGWAPRFADAEAGWRAMAGEL